MRRKYIVDTNIIFSSLLANKSNVRDILLNDNHEFYAPNLLITEIFKHKEKLIKFSKLNDEDFLIFFNLCIERIHFIPLELISLESRQEAYDKKLIEGLKEKGFNQFFKN